MSHLASRTFSFHSRSFRQVLIGWSWALLMRKKVDVEQP